MKPWEVEGISRGVWMRRFPNSGNTKIVFNDQQRKRLRLLRGTLPPTSIFKIAAEFDVDYSVVRRHILEMGLPLPRCSRRIDFNATDIEEFRADWTNGIRKANIAADFDISQDVIDKYRKQLGLPTRRKDGELGWKPHEDAIVLQFYNKEKVAVIAKKLKRTRNAVISRARRLGAQTKRKLAA